ncbi:MAG TPA: TetR/AcrR family transcriptional regulator [Spirochaetota bacterium]|nr:TetR/AcrR family transcriptional regulator [Spirochaetota bacterium]HPS85126.1 TetR/AcrR family transcriptional regulator [Spirochaetota bacterium]
MTDEEIKDNILTKFRELWDKNSVKSITMDDLARKCGVSKKTIYRFYKGKDEIVHSIVKSLFMKMKLDLKSLETEAEKPDKAINILFRVSYNIFGDVSENLIRDVRNYYPHIQKEIDSLIDEFGEKFREQFKRGIDSGLFRDINPFFVFAFYRSAADSVFNPKFILQNNLTVKDAIESFRSLLFGGIVSGKIRLDK